MIHVAPIYTVVPGAVARLVAGLPVAFHVPAAEYTPPIDARLAFDPARQQYNSTTLLAQLLQHIPGPDAKLVAITDVDLFIPVLTFVFGEAQLGGSVAIVSTHRLRNGFYGLRDDPALLMARLEKEAVHELGHTFDLVHCRHYSCVMHSSTSVEGVDLKEAALCADCQAVLDANRAARRAAG